MTATGVLFGLLGASAVVSGSLPERTRNHDGDQITCQLDPAVTFDSPPMVKILSNITYRYALETQFALAAVFPSGVCDTYNNERGRFNDSLLGSHSILRPELYGLFCGSTCTVNVKGIETFTTPLNASIPMAPKSSRERGGALESFYKGFTWGWNILRPPPQPDIPDSSQGLPAQPPSQPQGSLTLLDHPVLAAIYRAAIQSFRANIFATQMYMAFSSDKHVWTTLCKELDALALDTMFSTAMPKDMACEMVNVTDWSDRPQPSPQQSNPSEFSFQRLLRVNGELLGGATRASFSSMLALREACAIVDFSNDVHTRLELLDVSWRDFRRALCAGRLFPPPPEVIWRELEKAMVNLFAQTLWLSGSSKEFRKLICEGWNTDSGQLVAFNKSALAGLGMKDSELNKAIGDRCSAVEPL